MKNLLYICLICVVSFSCNNKENIANFSNDYYSVDFEEAMSNEKKLYLSEFADTLEYLELKTPDDIIITAIMDLISVDDFYIIHCRDGIFKFSKDGNYITRIGHQGQGPNEYLHIMGIDVDRDKKEIVQSDFEKTLFYDYDGNLLRVEKCGQLYALGIENSIIWSSAFDINIYESLLYALNEKRDTIFNMPNPRYGKESTNIDGIRSSTPVRLKEFYRYDDNLYYKGRSSNDTIFLLSAAGVKPHFIMDMGKYKLPFDYEPWHSWDKFSRYGNRYFGITYACEDDNYLYCMAQRYRSISGNNYNQTDDDFRYLLYDKSKRESIIAKNKMIDDITGGPSFWPEWIMDDYFIYAIGWYNLQEKIEEGNYELSPAVKKQFATFNDGTNDLLIMCKKKFK